MANIKLALDQITRNLIIGAITDFSIILSGQEVSEDEIRKLEEQANKLIQATNNLRRLREEVGEPRTKSLRKTVTPSMLLEINYEQKREILNLLQKNLDYTIELFDDIPEDAKAALINDNAHLVTTLKELKFMSPRMFIVSNKTLKGTPNVSKGMFFAMTLVS